MAQSALALLINARNADNATLRAMLAQAFADDAKHYTQANNMEPLQSALSALPMGKAHIKGPQNKALGEAIAAGVAALKAALPDGQGWIGAARGSFSKATTNDRAPYNVAHAVGVDAFTASLDASEAWADKVVLTAEEKAAKKAEKKAEKEEAEAEAAQQAVDMAIKAGHVIPADQVRTIDAYSITALCEAITQRIKAHGVDDAGRAALLELATLEASMALKAAA